MSWSPNTKDLKVNSSELFDFLFIIPTELGDLASLNLSVRDVDVFSGDVDVIEEVVVHVIVVGLGVGPFDGVVLIEVERYDVFKTDFSILI